MGTRVWSQDAFRISSQEEVASPQETSRPCPDTEKPVLVMRPQDVDGAAEDPVAGVNLAYTIHFYANTHKQAVG